MSDRLENKQNYNSTKNRILVYLFVVSIFILILTLFANTWISEQNVKSIVIKGNTFIPNDELYSLIKNITQNNRYENLSLSNLKKKIERHPFVKEAFLVKRNTSIIEIEIKERIPKAITVKDNGNLVYVDKDGIIMPYRLSARFMNLPVFQGYYTNKKIDRSSIISGIQLFEKINDEINLLDISEINFNQTTKEFDLITSNYTFPIKFGKMINADMKIKKLKPLATKVLNAAQDIKINHVDLRWKDKIILSFNNFNEYD